MMLKKTVGAALATSPIWLLVGSITYMEGWKAGLFVTSGTIVVLTIVVFGVVLWVD